MPCEIMPYKAFPNDDFLLGQVKNIATDENYIFLRILSTLLVK